MQVRFGGRRPARPVVVMGAAPAPRRRRFGLGWVPILLVLGFVLYMVWKIMG